VSDISERQLSPDGHYYWDGQQWLPVESPPVEPVPPAATAPYGEPVREPVRDAGVSRSEAAAHADIRRFRFAVAVIAGLVGAITVQLCIVPIIDTSFFATRDYSEDTRNAIRGAADAVGLVLVFLLTAPWRR
jgi:hypothetical protein